MHGEGSMPDNIVNLADLHRVYVQNRTQWDDDPADTIYYLVVGEDDDEFLCHRFEVSKLDPNSTFFGVDEVKLPKRWFLDSHTLVPDQALWLNRMRDSLRDQVRDANASLVRLTNFYRRFDRLVVSIKPGLSLS